MTKRQKTYAIALGLLMIAGVFAANSGWLSRLTTDETVAAREVDNRPAPLPVNVAEVKLVNEFKQGRSFTGTIRARQRSELAFELNGKVTEVLVDEGDQVEKGQDIARLDTSTLQARKDAIVAQVASAKSVLAELQAGPRQQTIDTARERANAALSEWNRAKLNLSRRKALRNERAISVEEYDQAVYSEKTAEANFEAAKQTLAELEAGTRSEKIDAQINVVNQLEASVKEIDVSIDKSTLKAPFNGVVANCYLDPGTIAVASAPVVKIVEQSALEAWIGVPIELAGNLGVGDEHKIYVNGNQYEAVVRAMMPEIDTRTQTRTVLFKMDEEASKFVVSGQICHVQLEEEVQVSGYWIPTSSLAKGVRGLFSVMVLEPESEDDSFKVAKRDVVIIYSSESAVLARGTIVEGDLIVRDGIHRIADGQRVSPVYESNKVDVAGLGQ